jgi:hypothetical protein
MDFYLTTSASTFPRIKITWIAKFANFVLRAEIATMIPHFSMLFLAVVMYLHLLA